MLPTKRNVKRVPGAEVEGEFPIHFIYTAGDVNEKFFYGLKDKKIMGNTCGSCSKTYVPPKLFCEDCFDELGEDSFKELGESAELFSFTEVHYDHRGDKLAEPFFLGLFKIDGSNTTFYHKLVGVKEPKIGMKLKVKWADKRSASLMDIEGFTQ